MANLTESSIFEAGIYQLETTDPVLGGASGIANLQAKQLANRTKWLKDRVDLLGFGSAGATQYTGDLNLQVETGWYYCTAASSNKPSGITEGWMQVVKYTTASYVLQTFYASQSDRVFVRRILDGPTYNAWFELANASSVNALEAMFVGNVAAFARDTAPTGWLKANGAAVSRTTYAALFATIGVAYGVGNGSTTFNLPDLRGYFVRGWDDGRGVDTGRVFGSNQADELKSHFHLMKKFNRAIGSGAGFFAMDDNGTDGSENTEATGGTETRPKNVALLYCIKY